MPKTNKIHWLGKLFTVVASGIMILLTVGKWLHFRQIPLFFGSTQQYRFSLFQIYSFVDELGVRQTGVLRVLAAAFIVGAVIIIVLAVLNALFALLDIPASKITTIVTAAVCVVLAGLFVVTVVSMNRQIAKETYGGIDSLLRTTIKPYLLVLVSVIPCVFVHLKAETGASVFGGGQPLPQCGSCGAYVERGALFCNHCGARLQEQNNETEKRFCTSCGAEVSQDAAYCNSCGAKLEPLSGEPEKRFCTACGAEIHPGAAYCDSCGAKAE